MLELLFNSTLALLFIDVVASLFFISPILLQMLRDFPNHKLDYEMLLGNTCFVGLCIIPLVLLSIIFLILVVSGLIHMG